MSGRAPTIIGGKGNVATAAAKAFVDMKVDVGMQKLIMASQNRMIVELVRRLGGEVRLNKDTAFAAVDLVVTDDPATNELVLTIRKSVDIRATDEDSPKI